MAIVRALQPATSWPELRREWKSSCNAVTHAETHQQLANRHLTRSAIAGACVARAVAMPLTAGVELLVGRRQSNDETSAPFGLFFPGMGVLQLAVSGSALSMLIPSLLISERLPALEHGSDVSVLRRGVTVGLNTLCSAYVGIIVAPAELAIKLLGCVGSFPQMAAVWLGGAVGVAIGLVDLPAVLLVRWIHERAFQTRAARWHQDLYASPKQKLIDERKMATLLGCDTTEFSRLAGLVQTIGAQQPSFSLYKTLQNNLSLSDNFLATLGKLDWPLDATDDEKRERVAAKALAERIATQWWTISENDAEDLRPLSMTPSALQDLACPITLQPFEALKHPVALLTKNVVHVFEYDDLMLTWKNGPQENPLTRQRVRRADLRPLALRREPATRTDRSTLKQPSDDIV